MSTSPPLPLVSVADYLSSSYERDVEFVDGILLERGIPTFRHSLLQAILIGYFRLIEREFHIKALPELRTQIVEGARYRIPDLLLCAAPTRMRKIMNEVPLAVIEILSPDDKMGDTLDRFRDYEQLGVGAIVQMDPEKFLAHRFERGSLIETEFHGLSTMPRQNLVIPFDSEALFAQLQREINEAFG